MTQRVDEALRDLLVERADAVAAERDPYDTTRRGLRRARRRRWLATVTSLCLVAAIAAPIAVFRPFRDVPLEGWGVRGNLADDQQFVEAARQEAAQEIDGGVGYSRVIYAGEHGTYREAVVVVTAVEERSQTSGQEEPRTIRWLLLLSGPADGSRPAMEVRARAVLPGGSLDLPEELFDGVPTLAWARKQPGGDLRLAVLGPPGTDQIAYSARPTFHPDGSWDRSWRRLRAKNGVAYATLPRLDAAASLVRLRVDSEPVYEGVLRASDTMANGISPDPSDAASGIPPEVALNAKGDLRRSTGLSPSAFSLRMLWHGGDDSWLVVATRQDGVTFQIFSTNLVSTRVILVPRGAANRPVAAVARVWRGEISETPRFRVAVVALGRAQGHVELWHGDNEVATTPLDRESAAVFRGADVADAVRADDAELTFRVFDESGRQVYRGEVHDAWQPPWNQPGARTG